MGLGGPAESRAEESEAAAWRNRGSDPSEIVSRLEARNEYVDLDGEGYLNATIFRGDWAPGEHWQLRLDLPLTASDAEGPGSAYGLGDLYLSARGRWEFAEQWSLVGELGFALDTATDDAIGTGQNQVVPFGALVWKPSWEWILAPLTYRYAVSFAGDDDREEISLSEISPQALYHLPMGFWILVAPQILIDHEEDDDVAFVPEGEFGWVIAEHVEIWLRGGGKVAGAAPREASGWKIEAGVRYLFD